MLAEDGRRHEYSLVLAMRLEALPPAPLPLFHGGAPPPQGERVESVQLFKNGGVGERRGARGRRP